jgi:hypothetical protein
MANGARNGCFGRTGRRDADDNFGFEPWPDYENYPGRAFSMKSFLSD